MDVVIFETYDTRLGIVKGVCFIAQAVGQCIFPHILSFIINKYGLDMTYLLWSGIMLQTLPAILFINVDCDVKRPISYSRYSDVSKTYAIFNNDKTNNDFVNEMQLDDLSKKCWKSPSDDNLHYSEIDIHNDNVDDDDENNVTITPPPSPEEKRRNIFGVEILPEIPEESEDNTDSDEDESEKRKKTDNQFSTAIKRFSALGDNLDEYISKQIRKDSINEISHNNDYGEIEVTYDNISPVTEITHEKVFGSYSFRCQSWYLNMKRKIYIPSYKLYRIRRRTMYCLHIINDTFIKPLTRSLSYWKFYPALLLSFSKCTLTAISLPLLPLISLEIRSKIHLTEMNFLISLHAFTWICFLLSTPWLASISKRNFKYILVTGLLISTIALFRKLCFNKYNLFLRYIFVHIFYCFSGITV